MQGRIIVFDGASSSGKSSIIKKLLPMLDNSYQYIAVDDFVDEVFLEQQKLKLPEKEFFERVDQQSDIMYDKIRELVTKGKNVILDTVLSGLNGEESIRDAFEKLKGLRLFMVLIHCPMPTLVERTIRRNEIAKQENKLEDERSLRTALSQFGNIYRQRKNDDEILLGIVSQSNIENACEVAKKEFGEDLNRFEQFKAWLLTQLEVKDEQEVTLTTRLKYDCIVDTSKNTPQECAQLIRKNIIHHLCKGWE